MRTFVAVSAVALGALAAARPATAQPSRCTADVFAVGGGSVAVTVCAGAASGGTVGITETLRSGPKNFTRTVSIDLLPGAAVSRTIDDVALAPLGFSSTLHLTLAYRNGSAAIEHALLLPGAIPLK